MTETKDWTKMRRPLFKATRTLLLAAVGAAALARDEMRLVMERSVERGELAEVDARKLMREMLDRREKMAQDRKEQAKEAAKAESQPAATASIPSAEVEALTARIAELTRQIEELKTAKAA